MIIRIDPVNLFTVTDFDGNVLYDYVPKMRSELTQKYFDRLHSLINNGN